MRIYFLAAIAASAFTTVALGALNPIPLAPGSYNFDVVVERGAIPPLPFCLTATQAGGRGMGGHTWYEQGFRLYPYQKTGVPGPGQTFTHQRNQNVTFKMPPDYTRYNALLIDSNSPSGGLIVNPATRATNFAILFGCGASPVTATYRVAHANASIETGTLTFVTNAAGAWAASNLVSAAGGFGTGGGSAWLYSTNLKVSGASPVTSILFTYVSGGRLCLFAMSGNNSGSKWTPVVVSGFNEKVIVPKAFPITATLDRGTNMTYNSGMNTWFERGYVPTNSNYGLPPTGSILTSSTYPEHRYLLGNFSSNNTAMIDSSQRQANLRPANPARFGFISLIASGGNIGVGKVMTNTCTFQHADGTSETHQFIGYDWFETSPPVPIAWKASGRVNMANRTLNNLGGVRPNLFESFFALTNTLSPVTNIVLGYKTSPASIARTCVMAVGGSADVIDIVTQPIGASTNFGATVGFSVRALGAAPFAYQWLKDGLPLAEDSSVVGATAADLTLNQVSGADAGAYRLVISNDRGSVTSRVALLTVVDPLLVTQPVSQQKNQGETVTFSVGIAGSQPLAYLWSKDNVALAQGSGASLALSNLQLTDAGNYSVVVTNQYGSVTSAVASLIVNLATPDTNFNAGADAEVWGTAVQPDGKVVVAGLFTTLGGTTRNCIGRLNADGSLDTAFNPGANGEAYLATVQPDVQILIGGRFGTVNGETRVGIARLTDQGAVDSSFNPAAGGTRPDVIAALIQDDGKIIVGGRFTALAGQARAGIARINSDGTLDDAFNPGVTGGEFAGIYALAIQADGKIVIGGEFATVAGQNRAGVARLNPDGTLDADFNPGANSSAWPAVSALAVQPDGKILVAGTFSNLVGGHRSCLGRLNPDGSLDANFQASADGFVASLVLQTDGKILIGGRFTTLNGEARSYLGRFNEDGSLDAGFNPGASGGSYPGVFSLAIQPDGRILVGGGFTTLAGVPCNHLGRLNNSASSTESLSFDNSGMTWLRGGTGPEVWRTTFEYSADNTNWVTLGAGVRVAGGWRLNAQNPRGNSTLRARGYVAGGQDNASGWFVETQADLRVPVMTMQPISQTNNVGAGATFSVVAEGTPPLSYQWRKEGEDLPGQTSSSLVLTGLRESDQGLYSVVVSNPFGSVVSSNAMLVVNQAPVADASATIPMVISPCGTNASVILDGSRSFDPDGDLLDYTWYLSSTAAPLAERTVAVVTLPLGYNHLILVVSDGMLSATNRVTVEVITLADALERLMDYVSSTWNRRQPLIVTLQAALDAVHRGNCIPARNQLHAFQTKVRAQVAPSQAGLAAAYTALAQDIVDMLCQCGTKPGNGSHARFTSFKRHADGRTHLQFSAERGRHYLLEASTNLVNWEKIAVAVDHGDGTFSFEDSNAGKFSSRYYRVVLQ